MHNKPGAEAALVAVKAYNQPPEFHNAAAIQYLLCDLMHLLDDPDLGFSNFSFSEQLKEAYDDYDWWQKSGNEKIQKSKKQ